jgi:hypothetical protein
MPVQVPSADEIRKRLAEKKLAANKMQVALNDKDAVLGKKEEELAQLQAMLTRTQTDLALAKEKSRTSVSTLRDKLDKLVEKYGCEPAEELIKLTQEQEPLLDQRGQPILDEDGRPRMRHVLAPMDRAKVLTSLLEFRMPRLRSSEVQGGSSGGTTVVIVKFGQDPTEAVKVAKAATIDA